MDINLLALNVGNTRLAIGAFAAGTLVRVTRVSHEQRDQWPAAIAGAWEQVTPRNSAGRAAVAAAGVNPPLIEPLEHVVQQAIDAEVEWVGRQIDLPIRVLTESPGKTGVDRILNIAAAHEQLGKACAVVDAGTAITVDCCNDAGDFLGGAIAPGAQMMLDALHEKAASLPRVAFDRPARDAYGTSSSQAMLHGVYHGVRGMVKELVENYATALGSWPELIATGGDATKLFDGWELVHAISPDLTLYGIALAYADHHIKHGT